MFLCHVLDNISFQTKGVAETEKYNISYRAVLEHATDIVSARRDEHGILRRQRAHGFSDRIMRNHEPLIKYYIDLFI